MEVHEISWNTSNSAAIRSNCVNILDFDGVGRYVSFDFYPPSLDWVDQAEQYLSFHLFYSLVTAPRSTIFLLFPFQIHMMRIHIGVACAVRILITTNSEFGIHEQADRLELRTV